MRGGSRARGVRFVLWALLLVGAAAGKRTPDPPSGDAALPHVDAVTASDKQRFSIRAFFRRLDTDGDGQIEPDELSAYVRGSVGGREFDDPLEIAAATKATQELIDGTDKGETISEEELLTHITRSSGRLLTPTRVARWVQFGLSLPQYAEAFSQNAITALDFPFLLADHGATLKEDLGIKSVLHRGKISRALKLQLLGLGAPPGAPTKVRAVAVNQTSVAVQWRAPKQTGTPPVHAYVLQRRAGDNPRWENEALVDAEDTAHVTFVGDDEFFEDGKENDINDSKKPARLRQYRVVAWGGHGSSLYSDPSEIVDVNAFSERAGGGASRGSKQSSLKKNAKQKTGLSFSYGVNTILEDDFSWHLGFMRACASSLVLAGIVARFVFGTAAWMGIGGTWRVFGVKALGAAIGNNGFLFRKEKEAGDGGGDGGGVVGTPGTAAARNGVTGVSAVHGVSTPSSVFRTVSVDKEMRRVGSNETLTSNGELRSPEDRSVLRRSAMFEDAMAAAVAAGVATQSVTVLSSADARDVAFVSEHGPDDTTAVTRAPTPTRLATTSHVRNDSLLSHDSAAALDVLCEETDGTGSVTSEAKKKGRCCVSGCPKRWDKWISSSGFRMKHAHHFCGLCQRAYCALHTATSPHGPKGRCDPESKCVCLVCFNLLDGGTMGDLAESSTLPAPVSVGEQSTPKSRAISRWQSVKQYQLRSGTGIWSPAGSVGDLRGMGSPR